jgi:predicted ATP-dependent serine protease
MTEEAKEQVVAKMEEIGPAVGVVLNINMESYFDVLTGLVDTLTKRKGINCVYIASSVSASTISSALTSLDINTKHMHFVDCVSYGVMESLDGVENAVYVESQTMLENIVLKVEYMFKKMEGKPCLVILDSINSLAMSNATGILSEFVQVLMALLKSKGAYIVVLSVDEQLKPDLREMLSLVSDQIVTIK